MSERGEVLWAPPPGVWEETAAGLFATSQGFSSYQDLWEWSVSDLEGFWDAVSRELGVMWQAEPERVLAGGRRDMPGARWFPGGALNYAEHALRHSAAHPDDLVVIARSQTRGEIRLTGRELLGAVGRCAEGLRRLGLERGDRVAAYAPNIPETLVAFLASASIGAVWVSCAPEFGARAVVDRLSQLDPVVLIAIDGYRYGSKAIDRTSEVEAIRSALGALRHVISIPYLGREITGALGWEDLLGPASEAPPVLEFEAVPFDHPLYVLFSSGTTGLPKAIVHGHGGITLEHLKVLTLHQDVRPGDPFLWFTTTGWMMWNYLVSGLLTGATLLLFDGNAVAPGLSTLWDFASETGCTIFGTSAPFLMACRKAGLEPDRAALRWVASTGSPLPAEGFRWVHDTLGVPVSSISGGTDICTALVGSSPLVPVRSGEISCRLLGCAVDVLSPSGEHLPPGTTGELVITEPLPSMPVGFWGDEDGSRYRAAYFERYPGVWRHGDWITLTDDGACIITGRSDATLNRGGVRLGTSDFYAVVEALPEISDSLVIYLEAPEEEAGTDELLLFVAMAPGVEMDDSLRSRIAAALRDELSPRHVPDRIEVAPSIPRTLSGKKVEVPVKRILCGVPLEAAASPGSLAAPDALEWFVRQARSGGARGR